MSSKNKRSYGKTNLTTRNGDNAAFIQNEKLTEVEVGISEYINSIEGFSAILKARYSDFHVNEINLKGEIAKLTNLCPKFPEDSFNQNECETIIENIIPDICTQINNMLSSNSEQTSVEINVSELSKEDRTIIHKNIKLIYKSTITAQTISKQDKTFIKIEKHDKNNKSCQRQNWPKDVGEYVHFLVYKECLDTMEVCLRLSNILHVKASKLNYAGVKDRRAKTTQWFSLKKYHPESIANKTKNIRNIKVGNFSFQDKSLRLGQLKGNRFRLALRNITVDNDIIDKSMKSLKENGFINYYGLQRFGSDKEVPTYAIGVKLLKGQWKEACELILKVKKSDSPHYDLTKAKQVFAATSNAKLALNEFSKHKTSCLEYKLLEGLANHSKNDYVNALENIPRNSRLLYIHSFQSLIWNKVVSMRIKNFGLHPVVGDLVLIQKELETENEVASDSDAEEADQEKCENEKSKGIKVKVLMKEDLDQYSIFDIVLPLPGYDIIYPENEIKEYYKELLQSYNLTLEMPKQKVKTYNLSGIYRKIVEKVQNFSWKILRYNNPEDVLINSDIEELQGAEEPQDQPDGRFKALIMDFCLDPACYATMVVREVLKTDTNAVAHAKLNNYFKDAVKDQESVNTDTHEEEHNLLSNKEKFEEFKRLVFANTEDEAEPPPKAAKTEIQ